ncbi:accessory factor UbiK family protein [Motiliproteus sp. SC1-56]|uniref:accessory factor UbiK family protein n=1 Tax=Motiliproteus sp. SC1-56 TaxID=2799565 RepID=UPI001A8ED4FF|nr:accessory factor UbiK family protein [Motiliproteus sp. SC1-56]
MLPPKMLEGLNEQLTQLFGEGPQKTQEEVKKSINVLLQGAFSRLDLVTREEFEAQKEVLMRTRAMVEQLEQQVKQLESSLQAKSGE